MPASVIRRTPPCRSWGHGWHWRLPGTRAVGVAVGQPLGDSSHPRKASPVRIGELRSEKSIRQALLLTATQACHVRHISERRCYFGVLHREVATKHARRSRQPGVGVPDYTLLTQYMSAVFARYLLWTGYLGCWVRDRLVACRTSVGEGARRHHSQRREPDDGPPEALWEGTSFDKTACDCTWSSLP